MATCETQVLREYLLTLTEWEAEWLKTLLQNPVVVDEDPHSKLKREAIFTALLHSPERR